MNEPLCPRCRCCQMYWEECWNCEDGFSHHDCGEDCCCCLDPEPNVRCDICLGKGGYWICDCVENGKHGSSATSASSAVKGGAL